MKSEFDDHSDSDEFVETGAIFESWEKKIAGANTTEMFFQNCVARQPRQVVRYSYGGNPLWCTSHASKDRACGITIPTCEGCGCKRVFECQIMPGVLALKKKTFYVDSNTIYKQEVSSISTCDNTKKCFASRASDVAENEEQFKPTDAQLMNMRDLINESGLDFGVVVIWVCPNSCYDSIEEYALVQAPPDF